MPRLNLGKEPENWPKPTLKEVDAYVREFLRKKGGWESATLRVSPLWLCSEREKVKSSLLELGPGPRLRCRTS